MLLVRTAQQAFIDETRWQDLRLVVAHHLQRASEQTLLLSERIAALHERAQQWAARACQPCELPIQRPLVKLFFHRQVAQVPPQLQAVNAKHHLHRKRRTTAQSLVRSACMRRDQRHQFRPRHDVVHLVEEDLLAGLLERMRPANPP
jgi:hypothetical protein